MKQKELTYTVKSKVAHSSIKALNDLGFPAKTANEGGELIVNLSLDQDKIRALCAAIFAEDFSSVDIDEIDLSKVVEGLNRFLQKWLRGSVA